MLALSDVVNGFAPGLIMAPGCIGQHAWRDQQALCACMQSVEMANLSDRVHEVKQLDGEHTREVEDKQGSLAQDIKEVQHKHEDVVAELKQPTAEDIRGYQGQVVELESHVAQLQRDLESLQTRTVGWTEMQQLQAALVSLHAYTIQNLHMHKCPTQYLLQTILKVNVLALAYER